MSNNGTYPTVTVRIQRFNPDIDKKPHLEEFTVELTPGVTMLDALHEIKSIRMAA